MTQHTKDGLAKYIALIATIVTIGATLLVTSGEVSEFKKNAAGRLDQLDTRVKKVEDSLSKVDVILIEVDQLNNRIEANNKRTEVLYQNILEIYKQRQKK
jgi:uncharacterized protein (DUF1330 family)